MTMSQPQMHRLTLRFFNHETEQAYQQQDISRKVVQGRFAMVCGIVIYLLLGFLFDRKLFPPDALTLVWVIRLSALLVPMSVLALTFHPFFQRSNDLPLAMVGVAAGLGIMLLSQHLASAMVVYYYPMLILATFYTYNLTGTRFVYAMGVDVFIFLAYNLSMFMRGDVSLFNVSLQDFYIFSANLIGGGAGYMTELQRRQIFLAKQMLNEKMREVQEARHEADEANIAKSRFLAAVSHDLRQPIHAQGLFLNVLAATPLDVKQQQIVSRISAAAIATGEMLHTLMDFSRIEAGVIKPSVSPFRLQLLLNKIEVEYMPLANDKNLSYRARETTLSVLSDRALVETILRNLVSNAIRYTQRGGILLACRKRGACVAIEVYDTGIGIDPAMHRDIFREFHQLGNPERDRNKGLGLGLAIAQGLAQTLQHPLTVRSRPGFGSVFSLLLPVAQGPVVELKETVKVSPVHKTGVRVLLIDDDEAVRQGTQQQLQEWGFECLGVESIEQALAAAQTFPPDVVISDYRLREQQTGAQAISALRELLQNPALPALLITGDTAPERIREAQASGIPLLHKPVAPNVLYSHLIELVSD